MVGQRLIALAHFRYKEKPQVRIVWFVAEHSSQVVHVNAVHAA